MAASKKVVYIGIKEGRYVPPSSIAFIGTIFSPPRRSTELRSPFPMASSMWRRASIQTLRAGGRWLSALPVPPRRFAALWGNGDYGRLGLGSLESRWRPTVCVFFQDDDLPVSIACGGAHTLFLTESGRVYASGLNKFGQLGIKSGTSHVLEPVEVFGFSEKVVEISAGYHHSSAITEDGKLFTWGNNSCGQLGLGRSNRRIVLFLLQLGLNV